MNKKIIGFLVFSLLLFGFSAPVQAVTLVPECAVAGNCTTCDFLAIFINFTQVIGVAAGTTAVVMLIIGGVMWILGGANEGMIDKGKKIVVGTFTGLIITFFAWTMVNFLIYALRGEDLDSVKIFSEEWWNVDCSMEESTDCTNLIVSSKCQVKGDNRNNNYYCAKAGASIGDSCAAGDCTCVNYCMYMDYIDTQNTADFSCADNSEDCPAEYAPYSDNTCATGNKCCVKIN